MSNPNEDRAREEANKGSDKGHSRFDVGSGYYGEPKTTKTHTGGNGKKITTTSKTSDGKTEKPRFVPSITYGIYKAVKNLGDKHNLKQRTKFARDEGLFRDYAKTHQYNKTDTTLDVMSDKGKDY